MPIERLRTIIGRALAAGARRISTYRVEWDIAGNCERPYFTEVSARPSVPGLNTRGKIVVGVGTAVPLLLELKTRCRDCSSCRKQRASLWRARIRAETLAAPRTWMGTLTLRPDAWYTALARCSAREHEQGVDFDALPERERLGLVHTEISREITLMWKRLRKACKGAFRYIVILEQHKSGVIHYHVLVHETSSGLLGHALLDKAWPLGFATWRVVRDLNGAQYVAKYLMKTALARVRASQRYGQTATIYMQGPDLLQDRENKVDPQTPNYEGDRGSVNSPAWGIGTELKGF